LSQSLVGRYLECLQRILSQYQSRLHNPEGLSVSVEASTEIRNEDYQLLSDHFETLVRQACDARHPRLSLLRFNLVQQLGLWLVFELTRPGRPISRQSVQAANQVISVSRSLLDKCAKQWQRGAQRDLLWSIAVLWQGPTKVVYSQQALLGVAVGYKTSKLTRSRR
jgi:hypothetical protein